MRIEVRNTRLGERLTFPAVAPLVAHLHDRLRNRGHWALSYDEVIVRADGIEYMYRGDYVLLHALAEVPLPWNPAGPAPLSIGG